MSAWLRVSSYPSAFLWEELEEELQNRVLSPEKFFLMARHLIPSDKTIKALKPGATDDDGAPVKRLNDGDGLFLMLWVKGGAHGWRFQYTLNGRRNILSLGTYPDTGLALARRRADEARALVAAGIDCSLGVSASVTTPPVKEFFEVFMLGPAENGILNVEIVACLGGRCGKGNTDTTVRDVVRLHR